jgi:hypothetical protein
MVAYWLVVGMVLWVLVWFCANSTLKGRDWLAGGKVRGGCSDIF